VLLIKRLGLPTGGNALFGANCPVDEAMIQITPVQIIGWGLDPEAGWSMNRRVEQGF
jgi:hypothetical protein